MANNHTANVGSLEEDSNSLNWYYELIGSPPPSGEHLPKVVKRADSDEKDVKIEELEKKLSEMSSQLEEANQRTENALAVNS